MGKGGGTAGFAFGGNGARKLSKACNTFVFFSSLHPALSWDARGCAGGMWCGMGWVQCHCRQSSTLQRTGNLVLGFIAVGVAPLFGRRQWNARLQLLSIFLPCTLVLHLPSVLPHHKQNAAVSAPSWPAHLWHRKKRPTICDRFEACMKNQSQFGKRAGHTFCSWSIPQLLPVLRTTQRHTRHKRHKWARWLHKPCRLEGPHCFRAGDKIIRGPQVSKVAT